MVVLQSIVGRAISSARCHALARGERHPRRFAVMEAFCLGEAQAENVCRAYGFDPEELVVR